MVVPLIKVNKQTGISYVNLEKSICVQYEITEMYTEYFNYAL